MEMNMLAEAALLERILKLESTVYEMRDIIDEIYGNVLDMGEHVEILVEASDHVEMDPVIKVPHPE